MWLQHISNSLHFTSRFRPFPIAGLFSSFPPIFIERKMSSPMKSVFSSIRHTNQLVLVDCSQCCCFGDFQPNFGSSRMFWRKKFWFTKKKFFNFFLLISPQNLATWTYLDGFALIKTRRFSSLFVVALGGSCYYYWRGTLRLQMVNGIDF